MCCSRDVHKIPGNREDKGTKLEQGDKGRIKSEETRTEILEFKGKRTCGGMHLVNKNGTPGMGNSLVCVYHTHTEGEEGRGRDSLRGLQQIGTAEEKAKNLSTQP